jgi:hypothetical protein
MRLIHFAWLPTLLVACTDPPLPDRLDEPDVAISANCTGGTTEVQVAGTVVDRTTGAPIAGATVDITEAWAAAHSFPAAGCRLGRMTTDAAGRFGPMMVTSTDSEPIMVMLVKGAGRAPTISDRRVSCLFGACTMVDEVIAAPSEGLADYWREELYAGGMPYALNRGLVAYTFLDSVDVPASGVSVTRMRDNLLDSEPKRIEPGSEARFIGADGMTLEDPDHEATSTSGSLLIGSDGGTQGYFRVGGDRPLLHWPSVGVIVATGWIYVETGHP